jgi:hypothetical protein
LSAKRLDIRNASAPVIATGNYVTPVLAGGYIEIVMQSSGSAARLVSFPALAGVPTTSSTLVSATLIGV